LTASPKAAEQGSQTRGAGIDFGDIIPSSHILSKPGCISNGSFGKPNLL